MSGSLEDAIAELRDSADSAAAQSRLLAWIAGGRPLAEILDELMGAVEQKLPGTLCSILLLEADGVHLRIAAAPRLPWEYNACVDGLVIGEGVGSCGTAAYRRAAVFVADILSDPLWVDYRDVALRYGLRSCWSFPIFASQRGGAVPPGALLGTFAIYSKDAKTPDTRAEKVAAWAAHLASIALEAERAAQALSGGGVGRPPEAQPPCTVEPAPPATPGTPAAPAAPATPGVSATPDDSAASGASAAPASPVSDGPFPLLLPHELKYTEAALRESLERFRIIARATTDTVWDWDLKSGRVWWNAGITERFGYVLPDSQSDFSWWIERIHPSDRQVAESHFFNLVYGRAMYWEDEYRFRRADGTYADVFDRGHVLRARDGQATRMIGAMQDITLHKQAEARLRDSERRYELALRGTRDAVWDWDVATGDTSESRHYKELLGFAPGELPDQVDVCWGRMHPEDRPRAQAAMQAHLQHGTDYDLELRLQTKGGEYRWFRSHGAAELDAHGEPLRVIGTITDITDRKRTEQELQLRNRAIHAVSQGILITDATERENPIVYASPAFERITGYTAEEILGRNCRFLQGADTDPATIDLLRKAIQQRQQCAVEILNYRKDQTPFWNSLTIAPLYDGDHVTHFVGVQTDVTARRQLEEKFRQAQKMEAVGRLAGGVAHDFNNLLTIINGYSELLLSELTGDESQRSQVMQIWDAGKRAAGLTAQLLAFSRKSIVELKVLDLNEVVDSLGKLLRRLIGEDITIVTVFAPALGRIKADPGQIEQLVMNLAVNARDAMPTGGRLTIQTGEVELGEKDLAVYPDCRPGRYVRLTLTDTGSGMSEEVKGKLFEPFFTTKGPGKGTGLGLATVYGIVKQAGGHVSITSQVERGTAVAVFFPAFPIPPAPVAAVEPTRPVGGAETVLVVEDEEAVRRLTRTVLSARGYQVLEASSGEAALRLAASHPGPIHLLLSDVVMPHMGGRELADTLRARLPHLKVLYMSGYTDDQVVRHGVLQAVDAFLQKPFTPRGLCIKIRAILDGQPASLASPLAATAPTEDK